MARARINVIAAALAVAACAVPAAADNWTGYTYSAVSTTAAVKGMERIVERVGEATDGELDITLHLGKALQISSSDITQAVGDRFVDFAADFFFSGNVPIARVLNLPMLIQGDDQWEAAYEAMRPYLEEGFAEQNVVYLGTYRYPEQILFTTFEIDSLEDLQGRKIRTTSPEQGAFIEQFGGSPITLAGTDVPTSLERGVIEGVLTASAGGAKNWHEFLTYNYRFPVNYGNSAVIANRESFDELSPENQEILRDIVEEETAKITEEFLVEETTEMQAQQAAGMTIVEADEAAVTAAVEALAPFWQSWAEENGTQYVEALAAVRAAVDK
jgi:TRAP-type C4-dicarboxylate transport system substrate-binding protein